MPKCSDSPITLRFTSVVSMATPKIRSSQKGAQPVQRTRFCSLGCPRAHQAAWVFHGSRTKALRFLGYVTQLDQLVRRHVNLLFSYEKERAVTNYGAAPK